MRILFMALLSLSAYSISADPIAEMVDLKCTSPKGAFLDLTIEARFLFNYAPEEMNLRDIVATVKDGDSVAVGRRDILMTDKDYKPTKYKNHMRFSLLELTDTEDFSLFYPDACNIKVLFPNNAGADSLKFKAPVVMQCDQSGGSQTLNCVATKYRD